MSDFIEQEVSVTSPPELSASTPTVSVSLPGTDTLADPETTAATLKALAPWLPDEAIFIQNEKED